MHRLVAVALVLAVPSLSAAETTLNVESLSVDGQHVRDLTCRLGEGGLFAMMGVVGALAKQKAALDACAPSGAAFRVKWTWGAKTEVGVEAGGDAKAQKCVARALEATKGPTTGTCSGLVLVGTTAAAEKAAAPLRKK